MLKHAEQQGFHFSKTEIRDLIKAWLILSLAFTVYFLGGISFSYEFFAAFFVSLITVGTAFILHELGHKLLAQHYGCFAEFRAFNPMLWIALIFSFFGFIFAAPGAVMINGPIGVRRNGKISALGPGTNIVLAVIFLLVNIFYRNPILNVISYYGFLINSCLALFNMLPLQMFDGKKIWEWDKKVYILMAIISVIFMVLQIKVSV
jgi:Zn-dependent protease